MVKQNIREIHWSLVNKNRYQLHRLPRSLSNYSLSKPEFDLDFSFMLKTWAWFFV